MKGFVVSLACIGLLLGNASRANKPIPGELLKFANVVVHTEECRIDVSSPSEMSVSYHRTMTILNARGLKDHGMLFLVSDGFGEVDDVYVQAMNGKGELIKKFRQKDFEEVNYLDEATLASDARIHMLDLRAYGSPLIVDVSYVKKYKDVLTYPDFQPQWDYHISVENAKCEVLLPPDQTLHFRSLRCEDPVVSTQGGKKSYVWSFKNLNAIPDEPLSLPYREQSPLVLLSPGQFQTGNYTGSFSSWDGYGDWNYQLCSKLAKLDQRTTQWVQQYTEGMSRMEKVKALYRYMQKNTRYISLQLGIGGWQPFDPNYVHKNKYGDCKALSWYTKSLLEAAGVDAYYTLIDAASVPRMRKLDFPSHVFNHVILTVPMENQDTIWLECTSQTNPFGFVGSGISDRQALLIDAGRAHVIDMPGLSKEKNIRKDIVKMHLEVERQVAEVEWSTRLHGLMLEDEGFTYYLYTDKKEQETWIHESRQFQGGYIEAYQLALDTTDEKAPVGLVEVKAQSDKLVKVTSKRMYFQPNFFQNGSWSIENEGERMSPVFLKNGMTLVAKLELDVPEGWSVERLPRAIEEENVFGKYSRTVAFENGMLKYRRTLSLNKGTYPPRQFNELVSFMDQIRKWDAERAVFVRD